MISEIEWDNNPTLSDDGDMLDLNENESIDEKIENQSSSPTSSQRDSKHQRITAPEDEPVETELKNLLQLPADPKLKRDGDRRLNVIHIRGVQEMNSQEVLDYFREHDPASLEWVDDTSCNVVFDNWTAVIRALGALACRVIVDQSIDLSTLPEGSILPRVTCDQVESPVPSGLWIETKTHEKSDCLLARIALLTDRKEPGAAKYSIFYQKHGNPHYGGKKQLVTKSTAEKIQARLLGQTSDTGDEAIVEEKSVHDEEQSDQVATDELDNIDDEKDDPDNEDDDDSSSSAKKSGLRMRMRADEEEELAKSRPVDVSKGKKSIWERLDDRGNRTSSVFDRLGQRSPSGIDRYRRYQNPYDISDSKSRRRNRGIYSPYSRY